jgi:CRP-like cAMP-binding protein
VIFRLLFLGNCEIVQSFGLLHKYNIPDATPGGYSKLKHRAEQERAMATKTIAALQRSKNSRDRTLAVSLPPDVAEIVDLLDLTAISYRMRPGQEIVSEGKRCASVFLITEGIAMRYRILRDGQRQILNFLVPGDFAGIASSRFENAVFTIRTLTPTVVSPIPASRLAGLLETQPRLASVMFSVFSSDSAMLGEHLISLGRRRAIARVAHLLLELHARLHRVGLADERSFRLPLTQEMISDALGLSIPYVNRVLQELRLDGLLTIKDQLENLEELAALADFKMAYLRPMLSAAA